MSLAFESVSSNFEILSSNNPCASFAASYSAFSLKSPLSLASAIAFEAFGRSTSFN